MTLFIQTLNYWSNNNPAINNPAINNIYNPLTNLLKSIDAYKNTDNPSFSSTISTTIQFNDITNIFKSYNYIVDIQKCEKKGIFSQQPDSTQSSNVGTSVQNLISFDNEPEDFNNAKSSSISNSVASENMVPQYELISRISDPTTSAELFQKALAYITTNTQSNVPNGITKMCRDIITKQMNGSPSIEIATQELISCIINIITSMSNYTSYVTYIIDIIKILNTGILIPDIVSKLNDSRYSTIYNKINDDWKYIINLIMSTNDNKLRIRYLNKLLTIGAVKYIDNNDIINLLQYLLSTLNQNQGTPNNARGSIPYLNDTIFMSPGSINNSNLSDTIQRLSNINQSSSSSASQSVGNTTQNLLSTNQTPSIIPTIQPSSMSNLNTPESNNPFVEYSDKYRNRLTRALTLISNDYNKNIPINAASSITLNNNIDIYNQLKQIINNALNNSLIEPADIHTVHNELINEIVQISLNNDINYFHTFITQILKIIDDADADAVPNKVFEQNTDNKLGYAVYNSLSDDWKYIMDTIMMNDEKALMITYLKNLEKNLDNAKYGNVIRFIPYLMDKLDPKSKTFSDIDPAFLLKKSSNKPPTASNPTPTPNTSPNNTGSSVNNETPAPIQLITAARFYLGNYYQQQKNRLLPEGNMYHPLNDILRKYPTNNPDITIVRNNVQNLTPLSDEDRELVNNVLKILNNEKISTNVEFQTPSSDTKIPPLVSNPTSEGLTKVDDNIKQLGEDRNADNNEQSGGGYLSSLYRKIKDKVYKTGNTKETRGSNKKEEPLDIITYQTELEQIRSKTDPTEKINEIKRLITAANNKNPPDENLSKLLMGVFKPLLSPNNNSDSQTQPTSTPQVLAHIDKSPKEKFMDALNFINAYIKEKKENSNFVTNGCKDIIKTSGSIESATDKLIDLLISIDRMSILYRHHKFITDVIQTINHAPNIEFSDDNRQLYTIYMEIDPNWRDTINNIMAMNNTDLKIYYLTQIMKINEKKYSEYNANLNELIEYLLTTLPASSNNQVTEDIPKKQTPSSSSYSSSSSSSSNPDMSRMAMPGRGFR
jgi:hypothetical protein